ncbi:flagellar type III secretion system pore protein FliP [Sediminicurvatus halobius]|uniref:Flagellar biosynthetic protein FliP n=1 Tax=Sediminicurvatus halobius TaxID=2182432 RepID=A0A2U2N3M8_9GAMM|nr:flagellar type III secretion system pore protein FliP [Spiribacter halobius]PWG63657.1 flagellar biosynthetic protein FliP [Spiribacter halobius]UEX79795.1 flagellar type III secretion system pore protein FliP [Spiribacter halobius]
MIRILLILAGLLLPAAGAIAQVGGMEALTVEQNGDGQTYSITLQVLLLMTVLALLPAGLLMMTAFTRIIVVLAILRQAIGTATTPSNQILIGLALFLTLFVMAPVFGEVYERAVTPYLAEEMPAEEAVRTAIQPMREFMTAQTREQDLAMFLELSGRGAVEGPEDVPLSVLVPAFVTSELKTAFQIGFILFLPFLVIDLVVASTLMSMGMLMLSPMIISLPFKIMLFVLVDGWSMVLGTLASSFFPSA